MSLPEWDKNSLGKSGQIIDAYKAAADVGRLAVVDQVSELDAIRTRSSTFLAFVGSATAFLVGTAVKGSDGNPSPGFVIAGLVGTVALAALLVVFTSVMIGSTRWYWPKEQMLWDSRQSGRMYADWLHGDLANAAPDTPIAFYRHLANQYELQFNSNRIYLTTIRNRYLALVVMGFVVLVTWGVAAWLFGKG